MILYQSGMTQSGIPIHDSKAAWQHPRNLRGQPEIASDLGEGTAFPSTVSVATWMLNQTDYRSNLVAGASWP